MDIDLKSPDTSESLGLLYISSLPKDRLPGVVMCRKDSRFVHIEVSLIL